MGFKSPFLERNLETSKPKHFLIPARRFSNILHSHLKCMGVATPQTHCKDGGGGSPSHLGQTFLPMIYNVQAKNATRNLLNHTEIKGNKKGPRPSVSLWPV